MLSNFIFEISLRDQRSDLLLQLVFFDGEEPLGEEWKGKDNTYGSRDLAEKCVRAEKMARVTTAHVLMLVVCSERARCRKVRPAKPDHRNSTLHSNVGSK